VAVSLCYVIVTCDKVVVDILASQNPSMLTMALRRVTRPDDVGLILVLSIFSTLLAWISFRLLYVYVGWLSI